MLREEHASPKASLTLPDDLRSRGLKPNAAQVLGEALKRGKISTGEIAHVIPKSIERDRERFGQTIAWLTAFLRARQVVLLTDKEEPDHRKQHPLLKKSTSFRNVSNGKKSSRLEEQVEVPDPQEFNEQDPLGRYNAEINQLSLLTREEEAELGRRILEDQDLAARNKLVEHNLRLVRWVASKFAWSRMEFSDRVQEGNIGLMKAAEKYDYRVGRFTTYAIWWIRQAIQRAIMDRADAIRLPAYLHALRNTIFTATQEVAEKLGRTPTLDEIAADIHMPKKQLQRTLKALQIEVLSLDYAMDGKGGDDGSAFIEVVPDNNTLDPVQFIEARQELEAAKSRLEKTLREISTELELSERNLQIFECFYGFDHESGQSRTLEAVGNLFHLTRERVRQIIADIWKKIDERGGDMDHDRLIQELFRIEELQKLVSSVV